MALSSQGQLFLRQSQPEGEGASNEMEPQTEGCTRQVFSECKFRKSIQLTQSRLDRDQAKGKILTLVVNLSPWGS